MVFIPSLIPTTSTQQGRALASLPHPLRHWHDAELPLVQCVCSVSIVWIGLPFCPSEAESMQSKLRAEQWATGMYGSFSCRRYSRLHCLGPATPGMLSPQHTCWASLKCWTILTCSALSTHAEQAWHAQPSAHMLSKPEMLNNPDMLSPQHTCWASLKCWTILTCSALSGRAEQASSPGVLLWKWPFPTRQFSTTGLFVHLLAAIAPVHAFAGAPCVLLGHTNQCLWKRAQEACSSGGSRQ